MIRTLAPRYLNRRRHAIKTTKTGERVHINAGPHSSVHVPSATERQLTGKGIFLFSVSSYLFVCFDKIMISFELRMASICFNGVSEAMQAHAKQEERK